MYSLYGRCLLFVHIFSMRIPLSTFNPTVQISPCRSGFFNPGVRYDCMVSVYCNAVYILRRHSNTSRSRFWLRSSVAAFQAGRNVSFLQEIKPRWGGPCLSWPKYLFVGTALSTIFSIVCIDIECIDESLQTVNVSREKNEKDRFSSEYFGPDTPDLPQRNFILEWWAVVLEKQQPLIHCWWVPNRPKQRTVVLLQPTNLPMVLQFILSDYSGDFRILDDRWSPFSN